MVNLIWIINQISRLERADGLDSLAWVTSPETEGTSSLESCDLKRSWSSVHISPGSHFRLPLLPSGSSLPGIMVHLGDSWPCAL